MIKLILPLIGLALLAILPNFVSDYGLGLMIGAATYVTLASAWALSREITQAEVGSAAT